MLVEGATGRRPGRIVNVSNYKASIQNLVPLKLVIVKEVSAQ